MILGIPWWGWLLGTILGFGIEWALEVLWWRKAHFDLKKDHAALQANFAGLQKTSTAAGADIKGLRGELDGAAKAKADLEDSLQASAAEVTGLQGKLGGLQAEFDKLKRDHGLKVGEIASLTAGAAAAAAALKAKEDEAARLKASAPDIAKVNSQWDAKLKAKDADLSKLKLDWDAALKAKEAELGQASADWAVRLKAKEAELANLKASAPDLGKINAEWALRLKAKDDELGRLRADIDTHKSNHTRSLAEVASLTTVAAAAAAALKAKDDELTRLKAGASDLGKLNADWDIKLKAKDAEWDAKLKTKDSDLAKLNADWALKLKSKDDELARLRADVDAHKGNHARTLTEVATLSAGAAAAAAALRAKDAEIASARASQPNLDQINADWEAKLAAKSQELAELSTNLSATDTEWRTRASARDAELMELRVRHAALQSELDAAKAESRQRAAELDEVRARSGELEAELNSITTQPVAHAGRMNSFAMAAAARDGVTLVQSECPQHLSEIKGIGTVFEQRLFEYGVGTFYEVSCMSDQDFRAALRLDEIAAASKTGAKMVSVDLDAIRADAARLANESNSLGRTWLGGHPDDLEPIEGIGRVIERRLYDAGICTYEALIATPVERLIEVARISPQFKTPDYASWIAQAKELLAKRDAGKDG